MARAGPVGPIGFPEMYERWLVPPLFRPWVDDTFEAIGLAPADRVLDVACGTGIVARVARERLGAAAVVVGVDVNPGMLAVARTTAPAIDWREGDVRTLPLAATEQFDVVVCQQGLQFMADKPAAVAAMRGALAPRGRMALLTWRPLEDVPLFKALHGVCERHLGPVVDRRHSFGHAEPLAALLREAGMREPRVRTLRRAIRVEDAAIFIRLNAMALVGMSPDATQMDSASRASTVARVVDDSAAIVARFSSAGSLVFDLSTNLATGLV
ncbi:MAG TPA: methyltransferase domain-containing protein [Vicinamibacterales bacterium]|nr:methyltransferase domain-containing protein [Vicinamibacterales bacterium]